MKKILERGFLIVFVSILSMISLVTFASPPPPPGDTDFANQNTEFLPGVPKAPTTATTNLLDDSAGGNVNGLLASIKLAINWVLWLLALIALIILIIQGIIMLVNARDSKKIEEGYTTVKNVAIALVFIGVSWLIISFIFRAIGVFTGS